MHHADNDLGLQHVYPVHVVDRFTSPNCCNYGTKAKQNERSRNEMIFFIGMSILMCYKAVLHSYLLR
jgi:hypothetical protein